MRYPAKKEKAVKIVFLLLLCLSSANSEIIRFAP